nr:hypothetical protein [Lentisphaerota bacterium]
MIFLISSLFWALSVFVTVRLFLMVEEPISGRIGKPVLWFVLLGLAMALLFRPHEDIFGGEDPGSYVNSASSYARNRSFFYIDPLLSQVPVEQRGEFLLGHISGYGGLTKDACLWVRDIDRALIGPHFLPAYPVLMSGVVQLFGHHVALFVVPLFTILAGLALRALVVRFVSRPWAGLAAFVLYITCPLVVWHGRNPRPEIIASFLLISGITMLLNTWQNTDRKGRLDVILGSICVGLAPFFHVTSVVLVISVALVVFFLLLSGRKEFLPFPIIGYLVCLLFAAQAKYITNYYQVDRFLGFLLDRPFVSLIAFLFLYGILALVSLNSSIRKFLFKLIRRSPLIKNRELVLYFLFAASLIVFFVLALTPIQTGGLAVFRHYLYLIDMGATISMLGLGVCLFALVGWGSFLLRGTGTPAMRLAIGFLAFVAVVFAGKIEDFFMTRYLLVAVVPFFILALVSLFNLMPVFEDAKNTWFVAGSTVLLAFTLSNDRLHLVSSQAHKGIGNFLQEYADCIEESENPILLCEYSRLAGPFEHVFGIPTLGIDNERKTDYFQAEQAWKQIMIAQPESQAFFATPFHPPQSDIFFFEEVMDKTFEDVKMQSSRKVLPLRVREATIRLRLYKMSLIPDPGDELNRQKVDFPFVRSFDEGNMGLRNFSRTREMNWLTG